MSAEGSPRAVAAALLANLGVALTKLLAFVVSGAASMLAEAIHSFADCGNQLLLLLGNRRSRRPPTALHPFGFGRERYLSAFLVSIVLFSVGGLFALYEAWHKAREVALGHGDELLTSRWWWVPLVVLAAAVMMEAFSLRTAIHEAAPARGDQGWVRFVRSTTSPELPVVLLEDVAALIGLAMALLGVGVALLTRNGYWDAAGTAGIGLLLVAVAAVLGAETKSLLLGEAAEAGDQREIHDAITAGGVLRVAGLRTLLLGPASLLVVGRVEVPDDWNVERLADELAAARARVAAAVPGAAHVYLDPSDPAA